ncbi:GMP synthase (glutamine-hydrolysing) [Fulvimarina manganoxydans]|uniref:GMP synthase (Glutamine-hydrolysing) n=1 Tax=Fulvimarina manganoxydans TaxID=937218 RepID=A0A1W2EG14_9HYPH|nr:glutamine amidotransferase [Fulvimarina manganoxydans]MEE2950633.1 glutamine amidotransferase [Pseudomonadota bacterium]SMD08597.1 GMP synthase (glutamine-hydrolysing) [Fulvimarina manganoxydans]
MDHFASEADAPSALETIERGLKSTRYRLDASKDDRPMLVVLHQENSTPGRVGQVLEAHGLKLDIRRPVLGHALPETLEGHRGAIVFGGPPSANDTDDYIRQELGWIDIPLKEDRPFLGICLGAQMLAKHLGADVAPHPEGYAEIGYYPLKATVNGRRFLPHWPDMVYQWHREGFELPRSAELLAEGDWYPNQAFRYGERAYGVQFHAELTLAMLHRWTTRGHERLALPGAQARKHHFHGRAIYDAPVRRWLDAFLTRVFGEPFEASG